MIEMGSYAWKGEHAWKKDEKNGWQFCATCGTVRRRDGSNRPCRGPVKIEPRIDPL